MQMPLPRNVYTFRLNCLNVVILNISYVKHWWCHYVQIDNNHVCMLHVVGFFIIKTRSPLYSNVINALVIAPSHKTIAKYDKWNQPGIFPQLYIIKDIKITQRVVTRWVQEGKIYIFCCGRVSELETRAENF